MKVSEVLFKAAQLIERDGHCKWQMRSENGGFCAVGAIRTVSDKRTNRPSQRAINARKFLSDLIGEALVTDWNDDRLRTAEEVIDMLVIASVEAQS